MSFGSYSTPTPAPSVSAEDINEASKEAARKEAEAMRKRRGMQSTILTGPEGLTGEAPVLKTALGA